ncbi:MAG: hypothetical protein WBG95_07620 [Sulfitobacter sp.]
MKPNFALSLSFEGIKLLHRAAGGWREVGDVPVTADDLAGELAMLRKTAASLEPGGVRTKLLIPESQIKYLTLDTPDMSDAARRTAAEAALEGATPYAVSELAYDISVEGDKTHVAAVARETLDEAEAFATEHRFHPVSFVAVPGDAPYLGEPFFGPTGESTQILGADETVEPDGIAVVIIGSVIPEAEKTDEPEAVEPTPVAAKVEAAKPEPVAKTESVPEEQTTTQIEVKNREQGTGTKSQSDKSAPSTEPIGAKPLNVNLVEPDAGVVQAAKPEKAPFAEPSKASAIPALDTTPPRELATAPPVAAPAAGAQAASAPPVGAAQVNDPELADGGAAPTGFSSKRAAPITPTVTLGGARRMAVPTPEPDSSSLTRAAPVIAADTPAPAEPVVEPAAKAGFLSRRKARTGGAAPVPAPAATITAAGTEAERMTVFGARTDQVGGKPRFLGLVMTVILLVFLAGVAAWAAVFLDDGIAGLINRDDGRATASAPENQIDPQVIRTPDGLEAQIKEPGVQIAALDPVLSAEDTAVLDALQDPRPQPQIPVISEQEATARYAVTGIWPLPPQSLAEASDAAILPAFLGGIDPVTSGSDALALPSAQSFETDTQLAAISSPPPFSQRSVPGAGDLLTPTAEGVLAPGGYTLIAASPPLKPPSTQSRFAAATPAVLSKPAVIATVALRPRNRPIGLAERIERTNLGGVSRVELAAFRPSLRPASLQDRAREAEEAAAREAQQDAIATAAAQAATAAAAAALALPPDPVEGATRLATAQSARPDTRPRNFARIVRRAQRAAPAPVEETRVAAAASVAPRTVAPALPSSASVARSATVKNAINLRRVNLIGVYGKPASRRALVRLANGRYRKVSVGDRIDGGRVSAINNSELRYTKGSRNLVLKMP